MDEKYLSELWNWTNSQDPTFKDRYTFDSWSNKLKSNEGYKKQFYGWVSGIDETFEERRPYNAWSEMVSTDKKKRGISFVLKGRRYFIGYTRNGRSWSIGLYSKLKV